MKIAYLTDRDALGGGGEYIRRQIAAHAADETRVFFAEKGECTAARMDAWGAELVHVNHLKALLQLLRNPLRRPRGRIVFVVHGIHWRKYGFLPKTAGNRLKRFLRLRLERWLYARVDELVALNRDDVELLRTTYRVKVPIRLEPNTVAPMAVKPSEAPAFAFVAVARFDFQKGHDTLLEAIALAQDRLRASGRRTLLIGDGEELPAMKALAERRGIADLVEFAGALPNAAREMRRGGILVAPSRWEGSPYAVLEALAQGMKVLASDCPGNRDLVQPPTNGWLFPVDDVDALADLLVRV